MDSFIEQILTMLTGSPDLGAFVQVIYFFALFAEMLGMPLF